VEGREKGRARAKSRLISATGRWALGKLSFRCNLANFEIELWLAFAYWVKQQDVIVLGNWHAVVTTMLFVDMFFYGGYVCSNESCVIYIH